LASLNAIHAAKDHRIPSKDQNAAAFSCGSMSFAEGEGRGGGKPQQHQTF
jgi:hypothetical protein